ncbi:MAG: hypothetical protein P0Y65_03640 [Candidatus Devosia phytovorans]|uniref:Uncharacterized protein n=1 Tax=Candidatus Devosia phytovorans TaxID=3121372 RepID=A0AAJ6B135_9HYPH|nr:hypothetical protein [Devosia sp.]WEK05361.1 MAG: hypothetical protein P0Y65_03640 [Devosia sp.]
MPTLPNLGPRAITRYNRFSRELAAFNYALRANKPGPVGTHTLFALNGLFLLANRLFRHHKDLPHFFQLGINEPISHNDLAIYVARLSAAGLAFEERYANLTEEGAKRIAADRKLREMDSKYAASQKP